MKARSELQACFETRFAMVAQASHLWLFQLPAKPQAGRSRHHVFLKHVLDACGVLLFFGLAWLSPLLADDTITNPVSPIVSYQYPQNFSNEALTNGGVYSSIISYQYPDDFSSAALTNGGVIAPIASYQYFEWPGDESVPLQTSPQVSYYYQSGSGSQPIVISGHVTATGGADLSGAQVMASVQLSTVAQATTDANGNYSLPALLPGTYALKVTRATYASAARVLTLNASTATQDFQLTAMPANPTTQPTTRQPPTAFTQPPVGPMGSTLKVFDGTSFVAITQQNAPSSSLMTIVLTHGWSRDPSCNPNNGIDDWPKMMALALRAHGIAADKVNIVGWDWLAAARFNGPISCHTPPEERTPSQGVALGSNLVVVLGASYSQPIHFLGHSLGTLVNAAAANYLHGDRVAQQAVSSTPWSPSRTHMTLFDQAEISGLTDAKAIFDGLTVGLVNPGAGQIVYGAEVLQRWKPSMPIRSLWADNFIADVGFYLPNTFNIALQKAVATYGWIGAHGYPMVWYSNSVVNGTSTLIGFQQSREYGLKIGSPPSAFPSQLFQLGDAYHQNPSASDPYSLEPLPPENYFQLIVPLFGNTADAVLQGLIATGQAVGNVAATVWDSAQAAGQAVAQGFEYAGNVAAQAGQSVLNVFNSAVMRVNLRVGPGFFFQQGQGKLLQSLAVNNVTSSGETSTQAMVWLPIQFPANATAMAFDFIVAGDPVDDVLVCGIETNNLFSLEAKYIPTNTVSASRLIDVSAWAGTTNELFFGLMGGTSTNAELQIDNIRFFSLQKYPRGDVNGDLRVTGSDSLLINQVMVGLRSNTASIFATTTFFNGDVNNNGTVSGADSLLINQTLVGLRPYLVTEILPASHSSNDTTRVSIYGIGFPTNAIPSVTIGAPVTLTLSNVAVMSREQITAVVPPGGGLGTGTVNVIYATTNGVISFGRFINQ